MELTLQHEELVEVAKNLIALNDELTIMFSATDQLIKDAPADEVGLLNECTAASQRASWEVATLLNIMQSSRVIRSKRKK